MGNRLFVILMMFSGTVLAGDSIDYSKTTTSTVADRYSEKQRIEDSAKLFDVTSMEWSRYETIMRGEGRYHWKDVDPIMVLGIYAKSESEKKSYARMMAQKEHRLQKKFIAFNQSYLSEFQSLYGHELLLDLNDFFAHYKERQLSSSLGDNPLTSIVKQSSTHRTPLGLGDHFVVFVSSDCAECKEFFERIQSEQSTGLVIDLYFVNDKKADIVLWAKNMNISPDDIKEGRITLNFASEMYDKFNRPGLPSAYFYDSQKDLMLSYVLD